MGTKVCFHLLRFRTYAFNYLLTTTRVLPVIRKDVLWSRTFTSLICHPPHAAIVQPASLCFCEGRRQYAKGKDKKKGDAKGKRVASMSDEELGEIIPVENMRGQMQRAVDILKDEFIKQVSLRSSTGAIDNLRVKVDGKDHFLQELAQVVRKNPKTLVVNMVSFPQAIPAVLQAIRQSGMNLNPQQDGTTLFIPVPVVTREHRENLAKNAKALFIKSRDSVKDVQNKYLKVTKRQTGVSEDTLFAAQQQITHIGNIYVEQAEKMLTAKTAELLGDKN